MELISFNLVLLLHELPINNYIGFNCALLKYKYLQKVRYIIIIAIIMYNLIKKNIYIMHNY